MRASYLDVSGALSFVLEECDGPAVLCLHTAGQNGVQWRHAQSELAARMALGEDDLWLDPREAS